MGRFYCAVSKIVLKEISNPFKNRKSHLKWNYCKTIRKEKPSFVVQIQIFKKSLFPKGLKWFFILCILAFTLSLFAPDDKISVAAIAIARLLHIWYYDALRTCSTRVQRTFTRNIPQLAQRINVFECKFNAQTNCNINFNSNYSHYKDNFFRFWTMKGNVETNLYYDKKHKKVIILPKFTHIMDFLNFSIGIGTQNPMV